MKRKLWIGMVIMLTVMSLAIAVTAEEQVHTGFVPYEEETTVLIDNEEAAENYILRSFGLIGEPMRLRTVPLSGKDAVIYGYLAEMVRKVASGEVSSTICRIPVNSFLNKTTYTKAELGVNWIWHGGNDYNQAAVNAFYDAVKADINISAIIKMLKANLPYEMYWYGNGSSSGFPGCKFDEDEIWFDDGACYEVLMTVSGDFSVSGSAGTTDYNTNYGTRIRTAASNAQAIVTANAGKSDYLKLKAYKDTICANVSYDDAAVNPGKPYGDPWQAVAVFDNDEMTNVVCEGYSKAFKYLCDLSVFRDEISVSVVTGTMEGGTGAGGHMWNLVDMDGTRYLVDVTNCDEGTIGAPDKLFMAGYSDQCQGYDNQGNTYPGYIFQANNSQISYIYDRDTLSIFSGEELTVSNTNYERPATVTITFDANGGSGTMVAQTVEKDVETELDSNTYTRGLEYRFAGWNTQADGNGTAYEDQATITTSANMTLYVQWSHVITLSVPETRLAGEPLGIGIADVEDAEYIHLTIRNTEGDYEDANGVYLGRYNNVLPLYKYGFEAGTYKITIYLRYSDREKSPEAEYSLTVTGTRPDAPETEIITNNALLSQKNQIQISADGMEAYLVEAQPSSSNWWSEWPGVINATGGTEVYNTSAYGEYRTCSFRFRVRINGCWSECSEPVELTWTTRGEASIPNLLLPENPVAGEPLEFTFADGDGIGENEAVIIRVFDEDTDDLTAYCNFRNDDIENGRIIISEYGLDGGNYRVSAERQKTDYDNSPEFTQTFSISGNRPEIPEVTLSTASIFEGEDLTLTAEGVGLESLIVDADSWRAKTYLAAEGRAVVIYRPSYSRQLLCRALVNGLWTKMFSAGQIEVKEAPEAYLTDIEPQLENKSITVGQPFSFQVNIDPRTEVFTVGIIQCDDNEDGYHRMREVEYERIVEAVNGTVTLPADYFTSPGVYAFNFNAYADGLWPASTGSYYVEALDSEPQSTNVAVSLNPGADYQAYQDIPVTISAPAASKAALKVSHKEDIDTWWYSVYYFDDEIPVSNGTAEVTIDGWYMDPGYYTFTAMAYVNGHWSDWSAEQTFVVGDTDSYLPEVEITEYPELVVSGESFTVRWTATEGAEKYLLYYSVSDSGAITDSIVVPASQNYATVTINKNEGQIQNDFGGFFMISAFAEGKTSYTGKRWDFSLIDHAKPTVAAEKTSVGLYEKTELTVSGLKANDIKIRINGAEKGHISSRTGNTVKIPLTFSNAGTYQVQVSVNYSLTTYKTGIWSSWSDPVTITVSGWISGQTLTLPDDTRIIEAEAFMGINSTYVEINSGCTRIENRAFADCPNLVSVIIPGMNTEIEGNPFEGCGSLVIVTPAGSAADAFARDKGIRRERK